MIALRARQAAHYNTEEAFTYYVDPSSGLDSNAGTKAAPFVTLAHALSVMTSGQSVGLKAGTTMRVTASLALPASKIRVGCYGCLPGAANMPIVSGGTLVTGWTLQSGSTYSAALTSSPSFVAFTTGGTTTGLAKGSSSTALTANQWFWASNVLYVNVSANPSTGTVEAAVFRILADSTAGHDVFVSRGISWRFGWDQAIALYNTHGHVLDRNEFRYIGYVSDSGGVAFANYTNASLPALFARFTRNSIVQTMNDGGWSHAIPNLQVDNNTASQVGYLAGDVQSDGWQTEDPASDGFTYHSSAGLWIHHNHFDMTSTTSPKGCIIYNGYGGGPGSTVDGGLIEYNTCVGGNYGVACAASNTTVRYNTTSGQVSTFGGGIHVDGNTVSYDSVVIHHNVVVNSSRDGIVVQQTTTPRTNWIIVNNTFMNCVRVPVAIQAPLGGQVENNVVWWDASHFPSFAGLMQYNDNGTPQPVTWDYNLVRGDGTSYAGTGSGTYTNYSTFAAWKTGTGFDSHSLTSDPLFTDAAGGDFSLQSGSPARGAGALVSIPAGATIWGVQLPAVTISAGGNIGAL